MKLMRRRWKGPSGFVGDEVGLGEVLRVARRAGKLCEEWPSGSSSLLTKVVGISSATYDMGL